MNALTNRTDPSPDSTLHPGAVCSAHISSVWPNGLFGAWMITWGWSCVSGPLWAPTRQPPPFGDDGQPGFGGVQANGTTPTHVASQSDPLRSPRKTVWDSPSMTSALRVRELR